MSGTIYTKRSAPDGAFRMHDGVSVKLFEVILLLIISSMAVFSAMAGQSIVLNDRPNVNWSNPARSGSLPTMLEMQFHDWTAPSTVRIMLGLEGSGIYLQITPANTLWVTFTNVTSAVDPLLIFELKGRNNVLVRARVDYPNLSATAEIWNADGSGYELKSLVLNGTRTPGINGGLLTTGMNLRMGFARVSSQLVPAGSRPPTTFGTGDLHDWKFEGNGTDAAGTTTFPVGPSTFIVTPGTNIIASIPKVKNTPAWAPFRPLRAGYPNVLDGSQSYTMADDSADALCLWQQLSGPTTLTFSNQKSCTPTVTGVVFGEYTFRLTASNSSGATISKDYEVGAVAYDDNGVVIYPDDRLYDLLGPTKCWTCNDWEWYDERLLTMAKINWNLYEYNGGRVLPETLATSIGGIPRSGTAYVTNGSTKVYGVGTNFLQVFSAGRAGPPIQSAFGASISLRNGNTNYPYMNSRIIGNVDSDTEITLADGWNWTGATTTSPGLPWGSDGIAVARAGAGTIYINSGTPTKVFGIDTNFQADICDGGSTPDGGTTINVVEASMVSRVAVASCQSATELTLASSWSRPQISSPGVAYTWENIDDWPGLWRPNGASTENYYDQVLAFYRFYYASGWTKPRDAARWLADRYWKQPGMTGAFRSLSISGLVLRQVVDPPPSPDPEFWVYANNLLVDVVDVRQYVNKAPLAELRESAYALEAAARMAVYDPDAGRRAANVARLQAGYDNLWSPAIEPEGFYRVQAMSPDAARVMTVTNGSATVNLHSGTNFPADYCGVASTFYSTGTLSVSTGSTSATLSGGDFTGQQGKRLFIRGMLDGQPYSQVNQIASVQSAGAATLAYPWPGTDITAWRVQSAVAWWPGDLYAFETMPVDASGVPPPPVTTGSELVGETELDNWYWCTVASGTSLTLDKPFTGSTASTTYRRIVFHGQLPSQPFMNALAARSFFISANALAGHGDTTRATGYRTLAAKVNDWLFNDAANGYSYGLPYFAGAPICHPVTSKPNICDEGLSVEGLRSYAVEANYGFTQDYLIDPTPEKRARGDIWFNAQFAMKGFSSPFPGDGRVSELVRNGIPELSDVLRTKNFGQVFGVGGGYQWAAARIESVSRPVLTGRIIDVDAQLVPNAHSVRVLVQEPSSKTRLVECEISSPCSLLLDRRLGNHFYKVEYRNEKEEVIARGEWREIRLRD